MANALIDFWRQDQAAQGITDDRPDYLIMRDELIPLAQQNPSLFQKYPDFAREYAEMREANAPSLIGEAGRAVKSGTQSLFSDLDAAAALGLRTIGAQKASDYYLGRAKELQDFSTESAPTVPTTESIAPGETGAARWLSKDTLRYAASKLGGALPALAEVAGLSLAGAALGSAAEPGVGTVVGAGEGALEGILDRGIIRSAIRNLVKKGAARGLTEEGVKDAVLTGDRALAEAITTEAKSIAAGHGGEAAALGLGAYPLSAGAIYKETGRPDLAAGFGALGALAGAAPVVGLPARVVRSMFPGLTGDAATAAANKLVGEKTSELLSKLGRGGIAVGAGTAGTVGMEAANIVAKNIAEGRDALELSAQDWNQLREAAIGGAIGSVPIAGLALRGEQTADLGKTSPTESPPAATLNEPTETPPATTTVPTEPPAGRTKAEVYRSVTQMAPEQEATRTAELESKPNRTSDENAELELLRALAPNAPAPAAVAPSATETPSAPAPVVPAVTPPSPMEAGAGAEPTAPPTTAAKPTPTREEWLRGALAQPDVSFKYTIMRMGGEYPDAIQVDIFSKDGENIASSSPEEMRAMGIDLPDAPTSLPQGQYTLEQIRDATTKASLPPPPAESAAAVAPIAPAAPAAPDAITSPPDAAPTAAPIKEQTFSRAEIVAQRKVVRDLTAKAEQAASAGKNKRAADFQKQASEARDRLTQMEANKLTGPPIPIGVGPEGENDLLSDIAEHVGRIRTKAPEGNSAKGGEYNVGDTFNRGAARLLRGGTEGTPITEALEMLNDSGLYKFGSPTEFLDAVDKAVEARRKWGESFAAQAYQRQIEDAALTNTGRRSELKPKEGVPIAKIGVGGKFFIRGEKFSIVDVTDDGEHYVVQDGHRFNVPADALIFPDRNTEIVPGTPASTDFLSPEQEAEAEAARQAASPQPDEVKPTVPSAARPPEPTVPEAAAKDLQNQPKPFAHGRIVEGEPTVDLRNLQNVTPEAWEKLLAANAEQGTRGSTNGNRAETRIAVALEAPNGQVVVTGLVKPQTVLTESGTRDFNALSVQRMGSKEDGRRVVRDGAQSPALVREVVKSGWTPIAVLHFEGEPGRIFERFPNRGAFDQSWNATPKVAGEKTALPHAQPETVVARRNEAAIYADIDRLGARLQEKIAPEERAQLENRIIQLYDELGRVTNGGQSQTGDTDISGVQLRQAQARTQLPIAAARAAEFQAVVGRLRNMGARVDVFAREFFQQGSRDIIQQQIKALQDRLASATPGQRAAIERQVAALTSRMKDLDAAQGATFSPWHVAVSVDDVQRANLGNFVTLLHEASEALGQRLNPAMRGRIVQAVDESVSQLREQARAASEQTGVGIARETGALDLLSETLAQKLTAAGVPDAPSLAQAIVRWVKDLYYRVTMAAQRAFGAEPDAQLALDWFENQLRREVFGDYDYRLARLFDRFLPESNIEGTRRFTGHTDTPGGMADFLDPISGKLRQPWVEPLTGDALEWNVAFRQTGDSPGGEEIPEPEARGRIDAATLNAVLDFATKLHGEIGDGVEWDKFWKIVGRGDDPKLLLGSRPENVRDAKIGGERMTETMNGLARLNTRILAEKLQVRTVREAAKARETAEIEADRVVSLAKEVNKIEGDRRNAALHEETLQEKAKAMVAQLVRDYRRGLDTAQTHGELAEAVRRAEGLLESDPVPEEYQRVFKALHDGEITVFDYVRAIARLDLPLSDLSVGEIVKAIRDNAESNETLKQLAANKPLAVALSTLARKHADQVDEIQLGWLRDAEQYRIIHDDLQSIRRAPPDQLRQLMTNLAEQKKAVGLRERIKLRYLERRRALRTAQDRIARSEARADLLEKAAPRLANWVEELQTAGSAAPSEWYPRDGAQWASLTQREDGSWSKQTRTLRFNPDGSAVDSDAVKRAISENNAWLHENAAKAGSKFYETVKRQTFELANLDIQQKYHIGWTSKIDRLTQTLTDEAQKLGRGGEEAARQLRQFHFITRSHREEAQTNAHWWTRAFIDVGKAAGIEDWGKLHEQLYNPINYFLNTNPGLEEASAIRQATRMARARLTKEPAPNFDERFAELLRRTKQQSEFLVRIGEQYGSWVRDPRLKSELRRAVAQGWVTTPRSLKGEAVMTIIRDMQKVGWKLALKEERDSRNQPRRSVVRATTFDDLTAEDASDGNTLALDKTLQRYFPPEIVQRWLEPFVNKGGAEIFKWGDQPIAQADVQTAWESSGRSILRFIDNMSEHVTLDTRGDEDPKAAFRLSILRQIDRLFGMEARLAYDSSQVRNLFDPMGPKPHLMMDARLNDLLPQEHLEFAWFDPRSSENLLAHVAFHAAFGRNGERMVSALNDLNTTLGVKREQYRSLTGTTRNIRAAESIARGFGDYHELERAAQAADRGLQLRDKIEGVLGAGNPASPFHDLRGGLEVMHTMAGQIVDNPKVGLYHVLQLFERPFAQRSLGPMTVRATAGAMGDFLKNELGSMLDAFNIHLLHASEYEKEIGSALGVNQRNLPWDVSLADIGQKGRFQATNTDRWLIKPLRMLRYFQQKGVKVGLPGAGGDFARFTPIPGLGVLNQIMQSAAMANSVRNAKQLELLVKRGIDYFSTHRDAADDSTFRFKPADLRVGRLDHGVFDWFRTKTIEYGMGNLEDLVRDAMPRAARGDRLLTKDQILRLSQMSANELDGESSVATAPSILATNPVLRMGLPLLRWPIWKMHQVHEGLNTAEGQRNFASVMKGLGALALWNLPAGIAFSFLMDAYDEKLQHKKSSLRAVESSAAIPIVGPALALATTDRTIPQELSGFLERSARAGNIYGLAWDMASQFSHPLDPSSGQRQFSLDQRVLAMSQFLNFQQAMRNLAGQDWTATWASFWRPFFQSLGGNGVLHAVDITNNLLGLDNAEARIVMRTNAGNYLRAAAAETGLELRGGSAFAATPTPLGMWTREMQTAAMANDRVDFMSAYRNAIEVARASVADDPRVAPADREREAEARVLQSWKSRDPLEIFRFRPTPTQLSSLLGVMDDQGRDDVRQALSRFQQFSTLITPTAADRRLGQQFRRMGQPPRTRLPTGSLLFSP